MRGRIAKRPAAGARGPGAPLRGGSEIRKNWGAAWCFRAMRVWSDKCWQCRKHGISLPKRHGGTLRSQSGEVAGPVVRGLEAPGAHPSGGAGSLREVRNTGTVRARGGGRRRTRRACGKPASP